MKSSPVEEQCKNMYETGLSNHVIAKQLGISRYKVWYAIKDIARKKKPREKIYFNGKVYRLYPNGYFRTTNNGGPRTYLHRDAWEFYSVYKQKIPEGFDVHHIDLDKKNNSKENLQMLSRHNHSELHRVLDEKDGNKKEG